MSEGRSDPGPVRKRRKTMNACRHCRQHKIKCSGQHPCQSCSSKRLTCVFDAKDKKVVISEQYLRELKGQATGQPISSPTTTQQRISSLQTNHSYLDVSNQPSDAIELIRSLAPNDIANQHQQNVTLGSTNNDHPILVNELRNTRTLSESHAYDLSETNERGHELTGPDSQLSVGDTYRELGHSSSWSFSRRVRDLIRETEGGPELHDSTPIRDGAYGMPWKRPLVDLTNLDLFTLDYAEYLLSTISFSLGSRYYLFDKAEFLRKLQVFYEAQNAETQSVTDLWLIQMLIVFGLGKSLISREPGPSGPSGHVYFARAMEALPDIHHLYEEPILAIEILCSFALFLQALDMRLAAHGYAGNAISMCLTLGLNRKHDATRISHAEFSHRSKLFWTAYVIDRKLSSLIGVPPRLHDEDIAISKPAFVTGGSVAHDIMVFHVELSSQLGQILNVVYGLGLQRRLGSKFVHAIQAILERLSDTSRLLKEKLRLTFEASADHESRAIASLHVLHHLCTILVIRPILFFLFEKTIGQGHNGRLSDAVRGLLRVCSEAALGIQAIMDELRLRKLIDLLFPFDVDAIFASAFVLVLIDIIAPTGQSWDISATFEMMDELALRGLKIVGPYKKDLIEVDGFRQRVYTPRAPTYSPLTRREDFRHVDNIAIDPTFEGLANSDSDRDRAWMAANSGVGMLQQDAFQSALDFFNYSLPDLSSSDIDPCAWMWDDQVATNTV